MKHQTHDTRAIEAAELRWRKTGQVAVLLSGLAVFIGLIALIVALAR